jgi:hypothetical protein
MERRHTRRYNFGAIAEVTDLGSRREFVATTRDLGLSGCFIKTTTPLAEGAEIRARITYFEKANRRNGSGAIITSLTNLIFRAESRAFRTATQKQQPRYLIGL